MNKKQNTVLPKMGEKLSKINEAIAEKENSRIEEKTYRRNCYEVFPFLTGTCCGGGGDGFGGLIDYKTCSYTNKTSSHTNKTSSYTNKTSSYTNKTSSRTIKSYSKPKQG